MMYTRPLRRMIRHLAQRLRMEGETFMKNSPYLRLSLDSQMSDYTVRFAIRPYFFDGLRVHRTVRIRGSPSVTATVCSKCAVRDPSAETTVH